MDTEDLVQEAALQGFRHLRAIEPRHRRALEQYLRASIQNRIRDEVRRAGKVEVPAASDFDFESPGSSPLERTISEEEHRRYRSALAKLHEDEQALIVGRVDLGYSYEQLAIATSRPSSDAARVAVRRALVRLAKEVS
jgi:RNA polymerase sigma factor (sigma-70 family)